MFYGVTLMLIVVIMLLVLDHKSLYTRFFVVMFLGVTIAFFFMIQQLSIFADYGAYRNQSNFVQLDWRIFQFMTGQMTIPIVWRLRLMNIGIALYLLGMTLFNLAFTLELQPKRPKQPERHKIRYLLLIVPAIELLVQDPNVSTAMYLLYHTAANPADILLAFRVGECIYKMVLLLLLARPVFILMRSIRKNNVFFLKRRLWMFSIGMLFSKQHFLRVLLSGHLQHFGRNGHQNWFLAFSAAGWRDSVLLHHRFHHHFPDSQLLCVCFAQLPAGRTHFSADRTADSAQHRYAQRSAWRNTSLAEECFFLHADSDEPD